MLDIAEARANLDDAIAAHCRSDYSSPEYRHALHALIVGAPCLISTGGTSNQIALSISDGVNRGGDIIALSRAFVRSRHEPDPVGFIRRYIFGHVVAVNEAGEELLEIARRAFDLEEAA